MAGIWSQDAEGEEYYQMMKLFSYPKGRLAHWLCIYACEKRSLSITFSTQYKINPLLKNLLVYYLQYNTDLFSFILLFSLYTFVYFSYFTNQKVHIHIYLPWTNMTFLAIFDL